MRHNQTNNVERCVRYARNDAAVNSGIGNRPLLKEVMGSPYVTLLIPLFCTCVTMRHLSCPVLRVASRPGSSVEAAMNTKLRPSVSSYEWRWWHNVLGLAIVLAIVVLMSW